MPALRQPVRQLFSDLNRNAKPVNKTIGLSFEMRDPMALAAKAVADEVPLFKGRVNRRSNSLAASSSPRSASSWALRHRRRAL